VALQVYKIAVETPLQHAPMLSKQLDNTILLKREDLQVMHLHIASVTPIKRQSSYFLSA
jgi:tryptophan synthase beta subunit